MVCATASMSVLTCILPHLILSKSIFVSVCALLCCTSITSFEIFLLVSLCIIQSISNIFNPLVDYM